LSIDADGRFRPYVLTADDWAECHRRWEGLSPSPVKATTPAAKQEKSPAAGASGGSSTSNEEVAAKRLDALLTETADMFPGLKLSRPGETDPEVQKSMLIAQRDVYERRRVASRAGDRMSQRITARGDAEKTAKLNRSIETSHYDRFGEKNRIEGSLEEDWLWSNRDK
jgi:hypothetical protein